MPPPVEHPLRVESDGDHCALYDGETLLAEARPAHIDITPPEPVTIAEAEDAAGRFDIAAYREPNPFPGCFTCGPDREDGEGLRLFPGKVKRREPIVAWPWVPGSSLPADDGYVDPTVLWAALDCPSGWAWYHEPDTEMAHVLGRMAAVVHRAPAVGESTVVAGWPLGEASRKRFSASALWTADGELLACARATWIALTTEQMARFTESVS